MSLTLINIIMAIIVLGIIPWLVGNALCSVYNMELSISKSFMVGHIGMWAVCQLVIVPLIILKQSFIWVVIIVSIIIAAIAIYGVVSKSYGLVTIKLDDSKTRLSFVAMIVMVGIIVVMSVIMQHTDADDARFVVNAVDILRTNRLLLTDVNTGDALTEFIGDLNKDVVAPWAVYIAYVSKLTGVYPSIMMHTIIPIVILIMASVVFWHIGEVFFKGETLYRCLFVIFVLLLSIYGHYSVYGTETFMLTRVWQGKAVVAAVGIPAMMLGLLWLYDRIPTKMERMSEDGIDEGRRKNVRGLNLYILTMTIGFGILSSMSFILTSFLLGCFGLVYGIAKRNITQMLVLWMMIIPNILYLLVSLKIQG